MSTTGFMRRNSDGLVGLKTESKQVLLVIHTGLKLYRFKLFLKEAQLLGQQIPRLKLIKSNTQLMFRISVGKIMLMMALCQELHISQNDLRE